MSKAKDFMGCRLNIAHDADIIQDLSKYTDATARLKEVYRKAMLVEQQGYRQPTEVIKPIQEPLAVLEAAPAKKPSIVWSFPTEPSVPVHEPEKSAASLKANILNNF